VDYFFLPSLKRNLHLSTLATPLSPVMFVSEQGEVPPGAPSVSRPGFHARVGNNSRFIGLSDDYNELLGGVEYRALTVLLWILSGVSTRFLFTRTAR
jgi:hypothetical protein